MQIINAGTLYNSDRVSDAYAAVNSAGFHETGTRDFTTLREKGRSDYQLIYIQDGTLSCDLPGGARTRIHAGEMLLYRPHERQHYTCHADTRAAWVHFTGTGIGGLLQAAGLGGVTCCAVGCVPEIGELVTKLVRELRLRDAGWETLCAAYLQELLGHIGRRLAAQRNAQVNRKYERLGAVIERMNAEYDKPATIGEYAQMCAVTREYFIHLFRGYTGMSPHAYLTRIRMDRARDLLSGSTLTVSEIASAVGYDNPLYFSRVFKNQTGLSPSAFRG